MASIEAAQRFLQLAVPEYSPRGGGFAQGYGEWLHIGTATSYIAFTEVEGAQPIENLRHIGLMVDDIDALIQRLRASSRVTPVDSMSIPTGVESIIAMTMA